MVTALALILAAAPTVLFRSHLPSTSDSLSMKNLGASWVRMDFNWFDWESTQGAPSFGYLDPIVDGAKLQGLKIFATVAYTPKWASSVASCNPHDADEKIGRA